jgi:hypothetical protein
MHAAASPARPKRRPDKSQPDPKPILVPWPEPEEFPVPVSVHEVPKGAADLGEDEEVLQV